MRVVALVMGIIGIAGLVMGIVTMTVHNIVIGFISVLFALMCIHVDRLERRRL